MPSARRVSKWEGQEEQGKVLSARKARAVREKARRGPVGPSEADINQRLQTAGAQATTEAVGLMTPLAATPGQQDGRQTKQMLETMEAGGQHIRASRKGIREQATAEKIAEMTLREGAHQFDTAGQIQQAQYRGDMALNIGGKVVGGAVGFAIGGPAGAAMGVAGAGNLTQQMTG